MFLVRRLKHLDDPADLGVAADDRVHLAACLASSTRSRPYFSRAWYLSSGFWSLTLLAAADVPQRLEDFLLVQAEDVEQVFRLALDRGQCEQEVFDGDVFVLHEVGLVLGPVQDP